MLAYCLNHYPAELRADFQETYGLNLDGMGIEYTTVHAAELAAMLPRQSRVFCAIEPANAWGYTEYLLSGIHYFTHANIWAKTKEARHKHQVPFDPIEPPKKKQPKKKKERIDVKALNASLARPRKAVNNGD